MPDCRARVHDETELCPNRAVLFIHEPGKLSPGEIIRVVDWIETQIEALLAGQTGDGSYYVAKLKKEV